ncbi:MAG TPA: ABC transporter substrate-binding protein [Rhodopila sp.]
MSNTYVDTESPSVSVVPSTVAASGMRRRALLGLLAAAAVPLGRSAMAAPFASDPVATIQHLNDALLGAMKAGGRAGFSQRFAALAPAVDQAFDLPGVLSVSVGPGWATLSPEQQSRLLDAFRRYTIASYVASFDSYNGQTFTVSPATRDLGAGRVVVQSRITPTNGDGTQLDYVVKQTPAGWKVVDVLAAGSISRVAVQRSDFRHLLSSGGGDALLASLQRKTADLSGGAVA